MIALERERSAAAIPAGFRGQMPLTRLFGTMQTVRDQMAANQVVKLKFEAKWSVTKGQLLKETSGKCAYCESSTNVVAFGDVEHYRPKSVYWWLAYVYDNYLASCAICNQLFKGDKFERDGVAMPAPPVLGSMDDATLEGLVAGAIPDPLDLVAVAKFKTHHTDEGALIPNPYFDDPARYFAWEVLDGVREVELIAVPSEPRAIAVVDAVERIYGLNRPELKRARYGQYEIYNALVKSAATPGMDPSVKALVDNLIHSMTLPTSQYSAMIAYFESKRSAGAG